MFEKIINHGYILLTILFAVTSQYLMRWQASSVGNMPKGWPERFDYLFQLVSNPWILLAFFFTGLSGLTWLLAMTKFELSYAYPFVSLNYVFILGVSIFLLHEPISINKLLGTFIIVVGILILARSS